MTRRLPPPAGRPAPLRHRVAGIVGVAAIAAGCASTTVQTTGAGPTTPICQVRGEALSALVLWRPAWRPDQKDVPQREDAARQGIEAFFAGSGCFARHEVRRLGGDAAAVPGRQQLLTLAAAATPPADRVVVVTVHELGPVLMLFGTGALVEGGTDVVLAIAAFDAKSGAELADFRTHWRNGGAGVVKGTATLPQDMSAALAAALAPDASPR